MSSLDGSKKGITRRTFIKSAAIGVAGVAAIGSLTGCNSSSTNESSSTAAAKEEPLEEQTWSFETPPDPIPDDKIKEVLDADVVVVGAGVAGITAALSAAEEGAKVIVIEKMRKVSPLGFWVGVVNSRLQKSKGLTLDPEQLTWELKHAALHYADERLIRMWAYKSGQVMDWILDVLEAEGIPVTVEEHWEKKQDTPRPGLYYTMYPTAHVAGEGDIWQHSVDVILTPLQKKAEEKGAKFLFSTPAVQLVKDEGGNITGVIAKQKDENYIRLNSKAVILATGGYEGNQKMRYKYLPGLGNFLDNTEIMGRQTNTGDGHLMALWVGADMDPLPHATMFFDSNLAFSLHIGAWVLSRQPWLNVNASGERYQNEDAPYGYTCRADLYQPGKFKWSVFDSKWPEEAPNMGGTVCERIYPNSPIPPFGDVNTCKEGLEKALEKGVAVTADTIQGLAEKMKVPVDTFVKTVERYNELAKSGEDVDFGKDKYKLTTIEKAPFYAIKVSPNLLVTLSGVRVNTNLEVLNKEGKPIPGLYATGNVSGGFFGFEYPVHITGVSLGRSFTQGYFAAKNAAAKVLKK